jgi:adenine-specific DNA-methyltransferase
MPTLDWIGKKAVINHHNEVPFHLLKESPDLSVGEPGSGNLLVQGDNLIALKALLPYYVGQVKCIYIDPPYNTGNENWVYNDNVNSPQMRQWLGKAVGKEFEDLSRHDKWLCMMYPRLALLHEFLHDDGVIFISIDDNELANLTVLVNDIFGVSNVLATLVWEKGKKGDAKFFSVSHEYIVVAAKSKSTLIAKNTKWRRNKPGVDEVLAHYNDLREKHNGDHATIRKEMMQWYKSLPAKHPCKAHKHYNWSDDRGLYFPDNFHGPDDGRESRPRYDIIHPITGKPVKKPSTGWRWEEARTLLALADIPPRIHFGPDEKTIPCRKSYLIEIDKEPFPSVFYKDGRAATLEVEQILGAGSFAFPKDSEILADLIGMVCTKNDIVLDSFAGSGTTAHAVLKLNHADKGKRKFILVEMDKEICRQKTRERLSKVIKGYSVSKKESKSSVPGLGGGFRFCELGETLFNSEGQIRDSVTFVDLAHHVFFIATGEPLPHVLDLRTPLLGAYNGVAVYLLYNGILRDRSVNGGNVLTRDILASLPRHDGTRIIYGNGCRISPERLRRENIIFRQVPYEVRVS